MKNTTHKRTQWSQSIIDSGQYQLRYTYQLQQGDKTHHTKHTTIHRKVILTLNHPSLQNKTTDVVIPQHSRKLLLMDILMSEICWAHKKWNKLASDIKLVFHSSTNIFVFRIGLSSYCICVINGSLSEGHEASWGRVDEAASSYGG